MLAAGHNSTPPVFIHFIESFIQFLVEDDEWLNCVMSKPPTKRELAEEKLRARARSSGQGPVRRG